MVAFSSPSAAWSRNAGRVWIFEYVVEVVTGIERHADGMRARLRGYPGQAAAIAVDTVELPLAPIHP